VRESHGELQPQRGTRERQSDHTEPG
jgi:hypothetical protein